MTAPPVLLLAAGALLLTLGFGTWVLLRGQRRGQVYAARVAMVAAPYARAAAPGPAASARAARALSAQGLAVLAFAARKFGYDHARAEQYRIPWWVVLTVALIAARVITQLLLGLVGGLAWAALPLGWVFLARRFWRWCDDRRAMRLYVQFPDALAMIVRAVRVGIPVTEAIRGVAREISAPTAEEFARLSDQLAIGVALEDGLRVLAARNRLPEYRFFATALSLQSQTGGGLTETLENLADVIRKRVALRARAHALASEARTSTYILAALPVFAGAALAVLNPGYMSALFTEPGGRKVFALAVVMLGMGMTVMRGIIKKSLS